MTKILLDTHLLLWWSYSDPRLPPAVAKRVSEKNTEVFISQVSLWEIAIKLRLGKLQLPISLRELESAVRQEGFHWLQLRNTHLLAVQTVEMCKDHRDPFDHLLVAQSRVESMDFLTCDKALETYGAKFYLRAT